MGQNFYFVMTCAVSHAHKANWVAQQLRFDGNFTVWASRLVCDDCSQDRRSFFRILGLYVPYAPFTRLNLASILWLQDSVNGSFNSLASITVEQQGS